MNRVACLTVYFAAITAGLVLSLMSAPAGARWNSEQIVVTLSPGQAVNYIRHLTPEADWHDVSLRMTPELTPYLTLWPRDPGPIPEWMEKPIWMPFRIPEGTAPQTVEGAVEVFGSVAGGPVEPRARLEIVLEIIEPVPTQLTIRAVTEGYPEPNAQIHVNGKAVGQTGTDGTLTIIVPAGLADITGRADIVVGRSIDTVLPGQANEIELQMSGHALSTLVDYEAVIDEVQGGVLSADFSSFTIRFVNPADGTTYVTRRSGTAELQAHLTNGDVGAKFEFQRVSNYFVQHADGAFRATDVEALRAHLRKVYPPGPDRTIVEMELYTSDDRGWSYNSFPRFQLGYPE